MSKFNDSVKWYMSDQLLTAELPLFTEVYAVYTAEDVSRTYDSIQDLSSGDFRYQRISAYSVERLGVDSIVLTCRYVLGSPVVQSLALITTVNNSEVLLAKITRDPDSPANLPNSYDRVFTLNLPYKIMGDLKIYPNISTRLRKYSGSPVGDELVTVSEHHHSVDWGTSRDSSPILSQSMGRYVASSDYNKQDSYNRTSYSLVESGDLNETYASVTGKLVDSGGDLSDIASIVDRTITSQIESLLANVMEEYLMATNSIQILGHAIPNSTGYSDLSANDQYLLYVDTVAATDNRNLKAITASDFRKWLVQKFNYNSDSTCTSNACVNIVSATSNVTVVLNKTSQVALVTNINSVSSNINTSITVYYNNSGSIQIYPRETAIVLKDSDGTYSAFKIGATDLVRNVLNGTYGFSKVAFSSIAGSSTVLDDTLAVGNGKVNSVLKGTLGVTGATTLTGGITGGLTVNSGNFSVSNGTSTFANTVTISAGGLSAPGQTISADTLSATSLSVTNFSASSISCTSLAASDKVTSTNGFFIS